MMENESIRFSYPEEIPSEAKVPVEPVEPVVKSELLPSLTRTEIPVDIEPSKTIDDSFQIPIDAMEDLKSEREQNKVEIGKIKFEEGTEIKETDEKDAVIKIEVAPSDVEEIVTASKDITEDKAADNMIEKLEQPELEKIKTMDTESIEYVEKVDLKEIEETPFITGTEKIGQIDAKEAIPSVDIKEGELLVDKVSIVVDSGKVEKHERIDLPIIDVEEIDLTERPAVSALEDKFEVAELPLIVDRKKEDEITETALISDSITDKQLSIKDVEGIMDVHVDKSIEVIASVTTSPSLIKIEEIEATEQAMLEVEVTKGEEIVKISTKLMLSVKSSKEKELGAISFVEKADILEELTTEREEKKRLPLIDKKPEIAEVEQTPTIIESRLIAQPYIVIAKIEEQELLHIISTINTPCVTSPVCCMRPSTTTADAIEITRPDVVEAEVVQITTQTVSTTECCPPPIRIISEYLKSSELKASTDTAEDRPEITGRKILGHKRLKDQSTVTTASAGSQTDKTDRVSHDRVVRDERERVRALTDEVLRPIKIVKPGQQYIEREIRTINYGGKSDDVAKATCNCCLCGRTTSPSLIKPRLGLKSQVNAKATVPPLTTLKRVFNPPKINSEVRHDRLCVDCKMKTQNRMPHEHIEKVVKKSSCFQESCVCTSSTENRVIFRKRSIEKKDQSCLVKISKRIIKDSYQTRKITLQQRVGRSERSCEKPLSPSCICFKLEKSGVGPPRKGNCYCAD